MWYIVCSCYSTILRNKHMDHRINITIEDALKERGQSLYWLSRTTGISYTTLWRLKKDRALGINFATLEKICVALECQPGAVMELSKEKKEEARKRNVSARAPARRTSSLL